MNSKLAPISGKRSGFGLRPVCRVLAALFGMVLFVGPAHAEPVRINQVVNTLKNLQGATEVQLTLIGQDPVNTPSKSSTNGPSNGGAPGAGTSDPKIDALLGGFPIVSSDVTVGIDDLGEEGEVDGTICDCGEILIAGGGFPKWPLLFLTAVPLVFIPDCDDCEQSQPTPTPLPPTNSTPTPTPTPEPASLLIFGTGLVAFGAGLRHRYNKAKLATQKAEEGND